MVKVNIDCQNGTYNNKSIETYKAFIFVRSSSSLIGFQDFKEFDITVYPNPSKNSINYRLDQNKGGYELLLIDSKGKLISKKKSCAKEGQLNLDIESGIYHIHFVFNQTTIVKKFVKL